MSYLVCRSVCLIIFTFRRMKVSVRNRPPRSTSRERPGSGTRRFGSRNSSRASSRRSSTSSVQSNMSGGRRAGSRGQRLAWESPRVGSTTPGSAKKTTSKSESRLKLCCVILLASYDCNKFYSAFNLYYYSDGLPAWPTVDNYLSVYADSSLLEHSAEISEIDARLIALQEFMKRSLETSRNHTKR